MGRRRPCLPRRALEPAASLPAGVARHADSGLDWGASYDYRVAAQACAGNSPPAAAEASAGGCDALAADVPSIPGSSFESPNLPPLAHSLAYLDATARGKAAIELPPSSPAPLAVLSLVHALVVDGARQATFTSNAVALTTAP